MKLKKLAAICKSRKRAVVYREIATRQDGSKYLRRQYLSDGNAMYQAIGFGHLTKESILRMFDVEETAWETWYVSIYDYIPYEIDTRDYDSDDTPIMRAFRPMMMLGKIVKVYGTAENGLMFIDDRYLDACSMNNLQLTERKTPQGQSYLAVFNGFNFEAAILPARCLTEQLLHDFRELQFRAAKEMLNRDMPDIELDDGGMDPEEPEPVEAPMEQMELGDA